MRAIYAIAFTLLGLMPPALAMEFRIDADPGTDHIIFATGEIVPGDDGKLHRFVAGLPASTRLVGIAMASPGGNYVEGVRLATTIRNSGLKTAVFPDASCASACFLMFAAGTDRMLFERARVGVHSASDRAGMEAALSEATTTLMARKASELGVPPVVIGKMVTTPPTEIAWLNDDDLHAMKVVRLESTAPSYEPGSPLRPGSTATIDTPPSAPQPSTQATVPQPAIPGQSPAFQQGAADRSHFDAWCNALDGESKSGAEWWAANRSQAARKHLSCAMAGGSAGFLQGCTSAQAALAPADRRRISEPEYRAGWNSL